MRLELPSTPAHTLPRLSWPYLPVRLLKGMWALLVLGGLVAGYTASATPVRLVVNGQTYQARTHRLTVEAILLQTGLTLQPADTISPAIDQALAPDQPLEISLARPVVINANGQAHPQTIYTHQQTPAAIYQELGIELTPSDELFVDGRPWPDEQPLPTTYARQSPLALSLKQRIEAARPQPVRLVRHPAIPIHIIDGDDQLTVFTTNRTVGEVLLAQNVPIYQGDAVSPRLSALLARDTTITIERSVPVAIEADGTLIKTRSRHPTVGRVLSQEGVALIGQDYTIPPEKSPLSADTTIKVVRVVEALEIKKETSPFETIWVPNPEMELDAQQIQQEGQEGIVKTRTRVRYENGQEVWRAEEETWREQEPADKIIAYGTNVVIRTVDTPDGEIEYWRKIRMLATSYSAATSGKDEDHPQYGVTRIGLQAGYGIVAVDPRVVPLRSQVYVPGYGQAIAGDTGGAILGKHIDLGFDEAIPPLWYRWSDVYLLTPAPPANQIRYVLPQWPQER